MKKIKLLIRYYFQYRKWKKAGYPIRSKKEIKNIHNICKKCPHFRKDEGMIVGYDKCNICQCNLHPWKIDYNKLAWGTTQCPDDPPRWPKSCEN